MKRKEYVLAVFVVVLVALTVFSVSTVFAGRSPLVPPPDYHPPVCYKIYSFVPGVHEMKCYDVGKDIAEVLVKSELKYDLLWDNENVSLRVYSGERDEPTFWSVGDKAGAEVSGSLP